MPVDSPYGLGVIDSPMKRRWVKQQLDPRHDQGAYTGNRAEYIIVDDPFEPLLLDESMQVNYDPAWKRELLWAIHNVIAHPLSELTYWVGFLVPPVRTFGNWFHDLTVPSHAPNTGRG